MAEIPLKAALNKAYIKIRPERAAIERFKANFAALLDGIQSSPAESEEFLKNLVAAFLKKTWYESDYFINTAARIDLVIHTGKTAATPIGVIIEAKRPGNKAEMVSRASLNVKAMWELLLYYLRETVDNKNAELKHLIITNALEWYVFDAHDFYQCFSLDKDLMKLYSDFTANSLLYNDNNFFYTQVAAPHIKKHEKDLPYIYFNIVDYEKIICSSDKEADNKLIGLYKLLSPSHLLKLPFANDSNSLNQSFYAELLYIMGLYEDKENGKKVIVRNRPENRREGSLLESAIFRLSDYELTENDLFEYALELTITWIDRILFLKLLESQQIQYQKGSPDYAFLNNDKIKSFSDLQTLFFKALAVKPGDRPETIRKRYTNIPYLNSSLFDMTPMEQTYFSISSLPETRMAVYSGTVLKDAGGRKRAGTINTLEYIFEFLNAYDFSSEGSEEIQEENKTLINASVLGLIFEKINGYRDGSYFTPGFITTYMCREVIRNVLVNKFNEVKGWQAKTLDDLYNKIEDITEANNIINSITICDPAVGSGHFLVSALNELIAVKSDLGVLADNRGRKLKGYKVEVVNDELMIFDSDGEFYAYNYRNEESRRIQETIFQEKRRIIENCLFGVDINPNSVKICRLRLWIELLKNAYYTAESNYAELETLPNIDINIKCGNSLISRFDLDIDLKAELKKLKYSVKDYQEAVYRYKNAVSKEEKSKLDKLIRDIKDNFRGEAEKHTRLNREKFRLHAELAALSQQELFDVTEKEKAKKEKRIQEIADGIAELDQRIEEVKTNRIYDNAFEWRFEFPEVLNDDGGFTGFDAVIGNPPYMRIHEISDAEKEYYKEAYFSASSQFDLYQLFYEKGLSALKQNGRFGFITSNKFCVTNYGKKLRELLTGKYRILSIVDVSNLDVFKEAATYPYLLFISNREEGEENISILFSDEVNNGELVFRQSNIVKQSDLLSGEHKNIELKFDEDKNELIIKIERAAPDSILAVYRGRGTTKDLFEKQNKEAVLSVTNKQIQRFTLTNELFYRKEDQYTNDFEPKILMKKICYYLEAALDETGKINPINTVYVIKSLNSEIDLKYILGILSSRLLTYYARTRYMSTHMRGGYIELRVFEVEKLPVVIPDFGSPNEKKIYEAIIELVDKVIVAKASSPQADTSALERELDGLVYGLYGLTEEEIMVIEGKNHEKKFAL